MSSYTSADILYDLAILLSFMVWRDKFNTNINRKLPFFGIFIHNYSEYEPLLFTYDHSALNITK